MNKKTTTDIVEILRRQIINGDLKPGEKLREVKMAEELQTSRTPIREAFRVLQAEGLLEHKPNCSVTVAEGLDEQKIGELVQVWGILSEEAAYEACINGTNEEKRQLLEIQEKMEVENFESVKMSLLDYELHECIAKMSRNSVLTEQILDIQEQLKRVVYAIQFKEERYKDSIIEHRHMVDAILEGDCDLAKMYTKVHFHLSVIYNRNNVVDFNQRLK